MCNTDDSDVDGILHTPLQRATVPDSEQAALPAPDSKEALENLWKMDGTALELT